MSVLDVTRGVCDDAADRAKSIKTEARVNQQATNKLIKELIAEKEKLLRELENAKSSSRQGYKDEGKRAVDLQGYKVDLQGYKDEGKRAIDLAVNHTRVLQYIIILT